MNQFFYILLLSLFINSNYSLALELAERTEFERGVFIDNQSVNGFGGDGGGELCYWPQKTGYRRPLCGTLVELGLRFRKPPLVAIDADSIQKTYGLDLIESQWKPSKSIVKSLRNMDERLKEYKLNLTNLALNYGDFSVFYSSNSNLSFQLPLKDNYFDLLIGSIDGASSSLARIDAIAYTLIDCKITARCTMRFSAVSTHEKVVLLQKNFMALPPSRASLLLLHEAFIRSCKMDRRKFCLSEALFADGVLYDLLENKKVSNKRLEGLLELVQSAHQKFH